MGNTEKKKTLKNKPKTIKKMATGTYILIIILNVNELNTQFNQNTQTGSMDTKTSPVYIQETHFRSRGHIQPESEGREIAIPCKWKSEESWSSNTCTRQKRLYKVKTATRDKEGHHIMIKGSIQEYTTIINIYAPNIGAP